MDITITLKLYAQLGDLLPAPAKQNRMSVTISENSSLNAIIDQFRIPHEMVHLVLLNGVFIAEAERDRPSQLKEGDTLAIWPPVAGG